MIMMMIMYVKYYLGILGDDLGDLGVLGDDLGDFLVFDAFNASIFLFWLNNLALANNIADIRGAILKPPLVLEGGFFTGLAIGIFYYNYNKLISQQILEYYIDCYNCCYKVQKHQ